jgi:CDP-glycerol glycerophosphotransferase
MPAISIIVPVHNVEGYVRDCLTSILRQDFNDYELLIVDDHSTDRSAEIVADVVADEARARVLRPHHNLGLGMARNLGLEHAAGKYILFLDSDDFLFPRTLRKIYERAEQTGAELTIFDFERVFWDGRRERNPRNWLLRKGPSVFSLEELPETLTILNVAWNKLYRRDLLDRFDMRFPEGYYEDVPWTYFLLCAAERIATFDLVAIGYRQRWTGSILRTASGRHFDILDQIDRLFEKLDELPELDRWRGPLWDRCASHLITILGSGEKRVPPGQRRELFVKGSETLRRHMPQGHEPAWGPRGIKARLIKGDAYWTFTLLESLNAARIRTAGHRNQIKSWGKVGAYAAARRRTIDERLAVYSCLWNRAPSGNPNAIFEAARELAPEVHGVWIVREQDRDAVPGGYDVVVPNTVRYLDVLARAKYFINDVNFPTFVEKRPGQIHLQTQHGTPLKCMGLDLQRFPTAAKDMDFRSLMKRASRWDYNLSSNQYSTEVWRRAFPADYETLEFGYPRNDLLVRPDPRVRDRMRDALGVAKDARVVLYAPTFRDAVGYFDSGLDPIEFLERVPEDVVLLIRSHYFDVSTPEAAGLVAQGRVVDVSSHRLVEELYLASDLLITDYSSAMFDFANLGRPIIIYASDWDHYQRVRGAYFDITVDSPGLVVKELEELTDAIGNRAYEAADHRSRLERFQRQFCTFDDGWAAERVVRRIFLGEDVEPPAAVHGYPESLRSWQNGRILSLP